ncbi:ABC-type transport auxiliary lipoprotein family protein [Sandaracinobacteroides hominis]|uniref:ABC-type transport auxiliary lipoprotein family protein n=1 Tax=Sandaracinobacteroides hominis TaxID=2780086 RepID=UPI0018F73C32|nr:ABC-type transport auxiliary lipoprotein family protein [Sandaracinobacteroides hominis]
MTRALPLSILAGCGMLTLSGCGPLVQIGGNAPRPDALYTISAPPPASVAVGQQPVDMKAAVTIDTPAVPGPLQTLRIPVTVSDTSIQYVQSAQWAEQPNRLFQRLLADTLTANGIAVIDQRSSGQIGGRRLTGQLMAFGVDVRGGPAVKIRYDATLYGPAGIRQRRFEREAALGRVDGPEASTALNGVANLIAADVAKWVGTSG